MAIFHSHQVSESAAFSCGSTWGLSHCKKSLRSGTPSLLPAPVAYLPCDQGTMLIASILREKNFEGRSPIIP